MKHNDSLTENDQPYEPRQTSASGHFDNVPKKSPEQDWQYKDTKWRQSTLAQEEYTNTTAWQIDNLDKLLAETNKDP